LDPITRACMAYDQNLRSDNPQRVRLGGDEQRSIERVLHPSGICLCDRRAAYDVMRDIGEITPDLPASRYGGLDFRVGNILEEFAAEAMKFVGALASYQDLLRVQPWLGRADMTVAPRVLGATTEDLPWLVEMKTSKVGDPAKLKTYYPKPYHIAQANKYTSMLEATGRGVHRPVLYYVTRSNWSAALYTWKFDKNGDCDIMSWDDKTGSWKAARTWPRLNKEIEESMATIESWYNGGDLPPRVGKTPDEHEFLCAEKEWRGGDKVTPTCPYFERCWETAAKPFVAGTWARKIRLPF
jgi:hypothetical protein